jgi:FtsP/CotA-like multicopper oxidase with cupredoxin domain
MLALKCNPSGRRAFLKLSGAVAIGTCLEPFAALPAGRADPTHVLRIRRSEVELLPGRSITTTTYDGQLPGPLLQATVGRPMIIDVHNETDTPERIRLHGQSAILEGEAPRSPVWPIAAGAVTRMELTPARAGVWFYHSDAIAATRLDTGLYSGQVGALLVKPRDWRVGNRGERECIVVLKACEPFIYRTPHGFEMGYESLTVNGRMSADGQQVPLDLTAGVRSNESMLLHVLNTSATTPHTVELPGHTLEVVALDGNPVPCPAIVNRLYLSPGERVSARVRRHREKLAVVCGQAVVVWDYTLFGVGEAPEPQHTLELVLERHQAARSGFNRWSINGMSFSLSNPSSLFSLRHGRRYRLKIRNTSDEIIPIHLEGHLLEIVRVEGRTTAGVLKDVVSIGPRHQLEVDLVANNPGPALLYCTRQLHKDFGLMGVVDYT